MLFMRVAIIGGGFIGLAAGIDLVDDGIEVSVFESEKRLGGLAVGFKDQGWDWSLERYYHHIFANDRDVIEVAKKVGLPAIFTVPKTNSWIGARERQLDSPVSLLKFGDISFWARIRMGVGILFFKLIPNGMFLEKWRVVDKLPVFMGAEGYRKVWKPLLEAKFGPYLPQVNLAWFWARVYKRTQALGYFEGGFQSLADKMGGYIKTKGGKILLDHKIKTIKQDGSGVWWIDDKKFDRVLITVPAPAVDKLIGAEIIEWPKIDYLHAQTLILEMDQSLMKGYWLNILEKDFPFLVAVEHTNFMNKKHYGDKVVVYLGNYLNQDDKRLRMTEEQLIKLYIPYIKKINPKFESAWIKKSWLFESPYSQPVFPINYSKLIPTQKTGLTGLYISNMSMVYPWDRGTNYAIAAGQEAVRLMRNEK